MIVKVNEKEYRFDGYVCPLNSIQKMADAVYEQGRADRNIELNKMLLIKFDDVMQVIDELVNEGMDYIDDFEYIKQEFMQKIQMFD